MFLQLLLATLVAIFHPVNSGGLDEFLPHSSSSGTHNNNNLNVSNSGIPHLPFINGYMGTHGTYRFLTIIEQTAWLNGEPKHGLWRYQDNGMVREYRKKGKKGLVDGVNPHDPNLTDEQKQIIRENYAHHIPEESWGGYKFPDDHISTGDGSYDNQKGYLNFIDLTIYHPKYNGKYNNHLPIDMPLFYCTMSQNDYPYVWNSWKWAIAQPGANKIGPLGMRAGLDIKENYENVLQFHFVDDGGLWANVGNFGATGSDLKVKTLDDLKILVQNVNYQRVSFDKMNIETYLVERMFFNKPYLFIIAILENKEGQSNFAYVRNDGQYWNDLQKYQMIDQLKTKNYEANHYPYTWVDNYPNKGDTTKTKIIGLPVYGTHHPDREAHGMTGGACPELGGDWARYPYGNAGAGFPTNYQEITPICDAIVIDMKLALNLWADDWNDPALGLANAAYKTQTVAYKVDKGIYGKYTDPYLVAKNASNPTMMDLTDDGQVITGEDKEKQGKVILKLNYTYAGKLINFNQVTLRSERNTNCPKCPVCPEVKECPTAKPGSTNAPLHKNNGDEPPTWGVALLALVIVIMILIAGDVIAMVVICKRMKQRNDGKTDVEYKNGVVQNKNAQI